MNSRYDYSILFTFFFVGLTFGILLTIAEINLVKRFDGISESEPADDIVTYDPGVHVFPAKDFPQRLAEFIDQNRQTVVITVCPLNSPKKPDAGFLVLTRPDPEWLKILPGSARPPGNQ